MSATVLVLNANFSPMEVVSWERAVSLLVRDKVRMVQDYAGRVLRSPSVTMPFPAVVMRVKYVPARRKVRLSRRNLLARDAYVCQYCGIRPRRADGRPNLTALTIDHVVPRAAAVRGWVQLPWNGRKVRVTSWENTVTACEHCNYAKAALPLRESGLKLARMPRVPSSIDVAWMSLVSCDIPNEWKQFLPADSPWRDYWDAELVDDPVD